jgi:hypothetical protein
MQSRASAVAVFLTQRSRSPPIRPGTQSGVYRHYLDAPSRLRHQLEERLHSASGRCQRHGPPSLDRSAGASRTIPLAGRIG